MKDLKEVTKVRDINFSEIVESLCEHIKENWEVSTLPKGFSECNIDDNEFDPIEQERLCESFKGFNDQTVVTQNFPNTISKFNIILDNDGGRSPFESLVGAILSHGMVIGEHKANLKSLELFEGVSQSIKCEAKYSDDVKFDRIERELEFYKNQLSY